MDSWPASPTNDCTHLCRRPRLLHTFREGQPATFTDPSPSEWGGACFRPSVGAPAVKPSPLAACSTLGRLTWGMGHAAPLQRCRHIVQPAHKQAWRCNGGGPCRSGLGMRIQQLQAAVGGMQLDTIQPICRACVVLAEHSRPQSGGATVQHKAGCGCHAVCVVSPQVRPAGHVCTGCQCCSGIKHQLIASAGRSQGGIQCAQLSSQPHKLAAGS